MRTACLLALLLAACSHEPVVVHEALEPAAAKHPDPAAAPAATMPPAIEAEEPAWQREIIARQSEEIDRLRTRIQQLKAELAEAREAATSRRAEELRATLSRGAPAPPTAPPHDRASVSAYLAPQVTPMGDTVLVTGRLYNSGPVAADVEVSLELVEDSQTIDYATLQLPVAARSVASYSHIFRHAPRNGRIYSARVALRY